MSRLYVIDFDRTLANTEELYRRFVEIVGIDMIEARREVENSGGSFDVIGALQDYLDVSTLERHMVEFAAERRPEYLMDGVHQLLDFIEEQGGRSMIMTYGVEKWQHLKIRATGLHERLQAYVTSTPNKADVLAQWKQEDGTYLPPVDVGQDQITEVILLDDKAVAFDRLASELRGYWVQQGEPLPAQRGTIPEHVRHVPTLYDVVSHERRLLVAPDSVL